MPKIVIGRFLTSDEVSLCADLKRKGRTTNADIGKRSNINRSWSSVAQILNGKMKAPEEMIRNIKTYLRNCERSTRKIREG